MRVIVTGDRGWECDELAAAIVGRLADRQGPDLVIVRAEAGGVASAFSRAALALGLVVETHPDPARMIERGSGLCLAVHRYLRGSRDTRELAIRAVAAGIPTYLIDGSNPEPSRLRAGDSRLVGRANLAKLV